MSTLKSILGDNADEKIQSVISALGNNPNISDLLRSNSDSSSSHQTNKDSDNPKNSPVLNLETLEYISKIKNIVNDMGNTNDSRANLLLSLKPYMRGKRQQSIDSAIRLLNLSKFSELFKDVKNLCTEIFTALTICRRQ